MSAGAERHNERAAERAAVATAPPQLPALAEAR
jgi:hypothetical protein